MPAQHIHIFRSLYMTLLVCSPWNCISSISWNLLNFVTGFCLVPGPDAVKYIVNHADIQAIFCVPNTLSAVSLFLSFLISTIMLSLMWYMHFTEMFNLLLTMETWFGDAEKEKIWREETVIRAMNSSYQISL